MLRWYDWILSRELVLFDRAIRIGNKMNEVQFGINKASNFSEVYKIFHKPVGWVQFVVSEKCASAYLFQIAWEKSIAYLLIK